MMPERRPAAERLQCLTGKDLDEACQAARVQGPGCLGLARVCSGLFTRGTLSLSPVDVSTCLASASRYRGRGLRGV